MKEGGIMTEDKIEILIIKDAEIVQDMIDLTNEEAEAVTKFKAGQGLLLAAISWGC